MACYGAQVDTVVKPLGELLKMGQVFVLFLVAAALLAKGLTLQLRILADPGRTLAFSMKTRNSFVVLRLALLPPSPASRWHTTRGASAARSSRHRPAAATAHRRSRPLCKCGARHGQIRSSKDRFLAVQRQAIRVLGHQHRASSPVVRMPLSMT